MYEFTEIDESRYGQNMVAKNQTGQKLKTQVGTKLNENYGIPDQMLTESHQETVFVHALTGKLYFFAQDAQAFISSE